MSQGWRWALDRLIITAIAAVVIGGGSWIALNTNWFKAPRRGTPVGEMTPEEVRRQPPYSGEVRIGGLRVTVENLLPTVRRLDGEGREFDGLQIRDR